jgi:hypothetical protein
MAQILLSSSLCQAARSARSPFLKNEAFRLLATLVATSSKESSDEPSDLEKKGQSCLHGCCGSFISSVSEALKDSEMKKTKRVRDILKATEKLVEFLNKIESEDPSILTLLGTLKDEIVSLKIENESPGVAQLCGAIDTKLESLITDTSTRITPVKGAASFAQNASSKKKSKGKKKKGKKR